MTKRKPWDEQEYARLRELIASGVSAARISVALKRPMSIVKLKAREIGMPFAYERDERKRVRQILESSTDRKS